MVASLLVLVPPVRVFLFFRNECPCVFVSILALTCACSRRSKVASKLAAGLPCQECCPHACAVCGAREAAVAIQFAGRLCCCLNVSQAEHFFQPFLDRFLFLRSSSVLLSRLKLAPQLRSSGRNGRWSCVHRLISFDGSVLRLLQVNRMRNAGERRLAWSTCKQAVASSTVAQLLLCRSLHDICVVLEWGERGLNAR